jgi:sorbitol-specific phosphotransferase system component IIC
LGNVCALLVAVLQLEIVGRFRILMGISENQMSFMRIVGLIGFLILLGPGTYSFDMFVPASGKPSLLNKVTILN